MDDDGDDDEDLDALAAGFQAKVADQSAPHITLNCVVSGQAAVWSANVGVDEGLASQL